MNQPVVIAGDSQAARSVLWTTIPQALTTEIGALAVMLLGVLPGMVVAAVSLLLLAIASVRIMPSPRTVRSAMLVSGPPVRYLLLFGSLWYLWGVRHLGLLTVLGTAVLLAVVVPLAGTLLLLAVRSRTGR